MLLKQAMQFIMIRGGDMSVTLQDFRTYDLMDELEIRGYRIFDKNEETHGITNSLVDRIFNARRCGQPYEHLLDQFLYEQTGRAV